MAIITNLQPPAGTPVAVAQALSVDVIDPVIEELRVFFWVVFAATGQVELVYDGDNFTANYAFSSITAIPSGRRFSVIRTGGWPSQPQLRCDTCACPPTVEASSSTPDLFLPVAFDAATLLVYLSLYQNAVANSGDIDNLTCNWLAPYDCTVVEVVLQNLSADYGTTVVGSHVNGNTTPVDTDTQSLTVAGGVTTFTLGTDVDAGQRLAISFDGQFSGDDTIGYVRIRAR